MTPEDQVWRHIRQHTIPPELPVSDGAMWVVGFALCGLSGAIIGGIVGFVIGQLVA